MNRLKTSSLYTFKYSIAGDFLKQFEFPWEALSEIGNFIKEVGKTLPKDEYDQKGENIWIAKFARVYPNTNIYGPAIICPGAEIRPGAFIRGNVIIGKDCVAGNSCEFKNSILFDSVQVPHFNYAGDSILGYKSHMGAGAITSNVKQDKSFVTVKSGEQTVLTELKKFGAMLGDNVEIGCNSVLNPGTVIGRNTRVYPLSMVRGFIPENSIHKNSGDIIPVE